MQDCGISIVLAMEIPQSCTKWPIPYLKSIYNFLTEESVFSCIFIEEPPIHFNIPRVSIASTDEGRQDPAVEEWVILNNVLSVFHWKSMYCQTSSISRIKSKQLNVSHLVLQLSLTNPLQPGVQKLRMKM